MWGRSLTSEFAQAVDALTLAASHRIRPNTLTTVLMAATASAIFMFVSQFLSKTKRTARRCYWIGSVVTTALFTYAAVLAGKSPRAVLMAVVLCLGLAFCVAYFAGWQLSIGGRIHAFWVINTHPDPLEDGSEPPPPPDPPADCYHGALTAEGMWVMLLLITSMLSIDVYSRGWGDRVVSATAFVVAVYAMAGYGDALGRFPFARGHKVLAAIAFLASIPLWLLPAIAYTAAYLIGQRWPRGKLHHLDPDSIPFGVRRPTTFDR